MAYLKKRGDKWMITIRFRQQSEENPKKWLSKSKTFDSKIEALVWAEKTERELKLGKSQHHLTKETFADLARVYLKEVTPIKKGGYNERYIISCFSLTGWGQSPYVYPDYKGIN